MERRPLSIPVSTAGADSRGVFEFNRTDEVVMSVKSIGKRIKLRADLSVGWFAGEAEGE